MSEGSCPICNGKEVEELDDLDFGEICPIHFWLLTVEVEGLKAEVE